MLDPYLNFLTLMVFLKEFLENDKFEQSQQMTKSMKNYSACKELTTTHERLVLITFMHEVFFKQACAAI